MKHFIAGLIVGLVLAGSNATGTIDTCQIILSRLSELDSKLMTLDRIPSVLDSHHRATRSQLEKIERMAMAVCLHQRTELYVDLYKKGSPNPRKRSLSRTL